MCQYFGGKIRMGKQLSKIIRDIELEIQGDSNPTYFEPFLGMGGVFRHMIKDEDRMCIGCDCQTDLMMMWKSITDGWVPPKIVTRYEHERLKNCAPSALRGYVGFGSSYMGRFFSGYTDTSLKSYNQVVSVRDDFMKDNVIVMESTDYSLHSPSGTTIYCDPPYVESKCSNELVSNFVGFDSDVFWDTVREWSKENIVLVSETCAPDDFKQVWSKTSGRNFYRDGGFFENKNGREEKLFCHSTVVGHDSG